MKNAVTEVIAGRMGYYKASKEFHVPQSTLEARVAKVRKLGVTAEEASKKGKLNSSDTLFQIHFTFTMHSYIGHPRFSWHESFLWQNKKLTESFFCHRSGAIQTSI